MRAGKSHLINGLLYVLADFRGAGIGGRLLRALFIELKERGHPSALVWVLADNPARYFYAAMGGRVVAERSQALWGKPLQQAAYGWPDLEATPPDEHR